jgi:phage terminase small subunit
MEAFNSLNEKLQIFVLEYVTHWNATRAAIKAGYSEDTAKQQGSRLLLTNVYLQKAVKEKVAEILKNKDDIALKTYYEIQKIAFSDIKDSLVFNEKGEMTGVKITKDQDTAVIREIEIKEQSYGQKNEDGKDSEIIQTKLKYHDKKGNLELLARVTGLLRDKIDVNISTDKETREKLDKIFDSVKKEDDNEK